MLNKVELILNKYNFKENLSMSGRKRKRSLGEAIEEEMFSL